jgi:uncharacterized membrane protein
VTFANPLPWWILLPAVAGAIVVAWLAYRGFGGRPLRRHSLSALRLLTLLLLIVFLMRPVARTTDDEARDAVVPILVDTSRSMAIEDGGPTPGLARIDRARSLVADRLLPALAPRFHVEVLGFGDTMKETAPGDLAATSRRSDLSGALAALRERYQGRAVAGIVLISDGGDTGDATEPAAGEFGPPIFAMGVGSRSVGRDREVTSVTAADAVLDGSRVDLAVTAVSHGHGTEPIELRLLENGRPIDVRRPAPPAEGAPVREVFQVSPGTAATVYTVAIPAGAGELVPENNARSVLVQPPSRPRRILLAEGAPGYEQSFLKRAWSGDPGLEIDSVVRKGTNEEGANTFYVQAARTRGDALTAGYPQTIDALFAYDAVVLANVEADQLTRAQLDATRAFVGKRGGGLLVLGARSFLREGLRGTALEEVLPLDVSDRGGVAAAADPSRGMNQVGLTTAGEAHPIMQLGTGAADTRKAWEAMPALASAALLGGARPGATVLAVVGSPGGAARPLVAIQRYGAGRSMVFTGEAAWRWRMLLPAANKSYDTFWRQAVRWLAIQASDPVGITVPAAASPGEQLSIAIAVRDAAFETQRDASVELRVAAPDGRSETLHAALEQNQEGNAKYVARFRPATPGVYRLTADARHATGPIGSAATAALVGGADLEMADPRLNLQVLQRLAGASGGRVIGEGDVQGLSDALRAGVPAAALAVRRDLWHNGWSFAAIALLLGAEWILRRRWGLR